MDQSSDPIPTHHMRLLIMIVCSFIVAVGCLRPKPTVGTPPKSQVTNINGKGTAEVWGVSFVVENPGGNAAGGSTIVNASNGHNDSRMELTLGDVVVQLARINEGPVSCTINDVDYGELSEGDDVKIDAERNVTVNGEARTPS